MVETLWFMSGVAQIRIACDTSEDGISVIEQRGRNGDSPPLHLHRTEDELFHVVEGQMDFQLGDERRVVVAGEFFLAPKGVPHSFIVTSPEARWFVTTTHGDFERFLREVSRTPTHDGWPEPISMSDDLSVRLNEAAARHGIEFVGPPLA